MNFLAILFLTAFLVPGLVAAQHATDFDPIERHALRAPDEISQDLASLTDYLISGASSETEKSYAIWVWITHRIAYDDEALRPARKRTNRTMTDVLRRRMAVCEGYARLMKAMHERAGIPCEIVSGYSKQTSTAEAGFEEADHAWNAVYLNRSWHLVDATWEATRVQKQSPSLPGKKKEDYIGMPETFVLSHLPMQPMWQLLDCPVPMAVFRQSADSINAWIKTCDDRFAYADSIAQWRTYPKHLRKVRLGEMAYRFHPTETNAHELAQLYIEEADRLTQRAQYHGQSLDEADFEAILDSTLWFCERAREYSQGLFDWQTELHVQALLNKAVWLYNQDYPDTESRQASLKKQEALLMRAMEIDKAHPPSSPLAVQIGQACEATLEEVRAALEEK